MPTYKHLSRKAMIGVAMGLALAAQAQTSSNTPEAYFADGYHGGIYGHYPVEWYTQFMVDQMNAHPDWKIGLEIEPETWDTVKVRTPEAYLSFRNMATGPRVEFTNPTYAQPYLYNISGESIIRQFQYGLKKLQQHFPGLNCITYSVEEPCFTSCLPQILKQFGFRHAVLKCPDTCWGGYVSAYGGELVNWIGPDGTAMLSVPRYACEELVDSTVWQTTAWDNSRHYINTCQSAGIAHPAGMCYQDAGWKNGPWLGSGGRRKNGSEYICWTDYIERISEGKSHDDWHFSQNDVRVALMWGSQVMQRIGREVRTSENLLVQAEKLSAMAYLETGWKPEQPAIDEAWRTLMLAQHHDSWIVPYNRLNKKGTWADNIALWTASSDSTAKETIAKAMGNMKPENEAVNRKSLRLFNTLGEKRTEIINTRHNGKELCFKAEIPAFGYATYDIQTLLNDQKKAINDNPVRIAKGRCTVETDLYRIVFDLKHGGTISSLYVKKENKEWTTNGQPFAELKGFFEEKGRFCSSTEQAARVKVLTDNHLVKSIRVDGKIAGTPFHHTYTLRQGDARIDCQLAIDWKQNERIGDFGQHERHKKDTPFYNTSYLLNLLLPCDVNEAELAKDAPFDVCQSQQQSTLFSKWDDIKHNIVLNWVDITGKNGKSLALLTDHTTSYTFAQDHPLALTVQYSGPGLWGRNYVIDRKTEMSFAFIPHTGTWEKGNIAYHNERWKEPVLLHECNDQEYTQKSFLDLTSTGYVLSAANVAENGLTIRLYNQSGDNSRQIIKLPGTGLKAEETDLNGKLLRPLYLSGNSLSYSMPRFGIRTLNLKYQIK